ncbi:MAG TPA: SDR family NAD(P)-dependent oxidoreductase [Candidatus Limnocylindrales bacterium]
MKNSKVVLIAGASSGIGEAAARLLARRGHTVYGSSRDPGRVQVPGVVPVKLEVSSETSVRQCVSGVLDEAGRIDAVVYSAGFFVAGAAEETTAELAMSQLDAYFVGAHRLVRAVLPAMREAGGGRLILMSSSAAVAAIPFHAVYSASKAALRHYAEALRYEVEPFGIRIACVEGTGVRTGAAAAVQLPSEPIAAYEPARTNVVESFLRAQTEGPPPDRIAVSIVRAIEGRRIRPVYRVGFNARSLPVLRALLPGTLFRRLFARHFGITAGPSTR